MLCKSFSGICFVLTRLNCAIYVTLAQINIWSAVVFSIITHSTEMENAGSVWSACVSNE